ncbi:MAG: acyl-CoA dehydrogenase [Marmoricola sp.]|nr:acyl-CoA dehydrogenase [Marmoricola sp.]
MRSSLRSFLSRTITESGYEQICSSDSGFDGSLWNQLAGSGWLDVAAMSSDGDEVSAWPISGVHMGEEFGRALVPAPVELVTGFLLPVLHRLAGFGPVLDDSTFVDDLPAVTIEPALALIRAGAPRPGGLTVDTTADGTLSLSGSVPSVQFAASARTLYLPVSLGATWALARIPLDQAGVATVSTRSIDPGRTCATVVVTDVSVPAADVATTAADGEPMAAVLAEALRSYLLVLDGKAIGAAQLLLEKTVAYVTQRTQFGVPVGSFQALKHRIADMATSIEAARSIASYAAWQVAQGHQDSTEMVLSSRIFCSEMYRNVCESAIQCHGGMGFTWEQRLHYWYKSALFDAAVDGIAVEDLGRLLRKSA